MDKIGDIEIRVVGKSGNLELKPDNYDIRHIASILQNVEDLLFPNGKKDRPLITYDIQEGSVRHIFKTPIQLHSCSCSKSCQNLHLLKLLVILISAFIQTMI